MKQVLSALERQLKIEQEKVSKRKMMIESFRSATHWKSLPVVIDGYVEELKSVITLVKNRIQITSILGEKGDIDFTENQSDFKKLKEIIEVKNICICIYPNACGFLWSMAKADSGTDLGYSGFTGNCKESGSFLSYEDALQDAINVLENYDLIKFKKENIKVHWSSFSFFAKENRIKLNEKIK
jgi:hypothetical protein